MSHSRPEVVERAGVPRTERGVDSQDWGRGGALPPPPPRDEEGVESHEWPLILAVDVGVSGTGARGVRASSSPPPPLPQPLSLDLPSSLLGSPLDLPSSSQSFLPRGNAPSFLFKRPRKSSMAWLLLSSRFRSWRESTTPSGRLLRARCSSRRFWATSLRPPPWEGVASGFWRIWVGRAGTVWEGASERVSYAVPFRRACTMETCSL